MEEATNCNDISSICANLYESLTNHCSSQQRPRLYRPSPPSQHRQLVLRTLRLLPRCLRQHPQASPLLLHQAHFQRCHVCHSIPQGLLFEAGSGSGQGCCRDGQGGRCFGEGDRHPEDFPGYQACSVEVSLPWRPYHLIEHVHCAT